MKAIGFVQVVYLILKRPARASLFVLMSLIDVTGTVQIEKMRLIRAIGTVQVD